MRTNKVIIVITVLTVIAAATTLLMGFASAQVSDHAVASVGHLESWHHIKSVWLPVAVGWIFIIQALFVLAYLSIALFLFFREQKQDQVNDATRKAREKIEKERRAKAENLFQQHVNDLNKETIEALTRDRILTSEGYDFRSSHSKEVSALDFFIDSWRNNIIESLEEQISKPELSDETDQYSRYFQSPWIDLEEAVIKSLLILTGTSLCAALGYALVFI